MPVVGGEHGVLDARRGQLADRAGEVVDDRVHDLPGLMDEPALAGVVDLLRADDDDLRRPSTFFASFVCDQVSTSSSVEVDERRDPRRSELPARRQVRQERVLDPGAELAALRRRRRSCRPRRA